MENPQKKIIELWCRKAENDIKTIENNLKSDDPPTDMICFHAQQAIEKYLKVALIYHGTNPPRTHDLIKLMSTLVGFFPDLRQHEEALEEVNAYGAEIRYPDIFYMPSMEEAQFAFDLALKIKKIILPYIDVEQ